MKEYEKILVAPHAEEFNCFADKGSLLFIADKKDNKKGLFRLPKDIHYFVTIDNKKMPSEIGIVKKRDKPITATDFAELIYKERSMDTKNIEQDFIDQCSWFLEKVNSHAENTVLGTSWFEKIIPKKTKELRIYKVFFRALSKEEKESIFSV